MDVKNRNFVLVIDNEEEIRIGIKLRLTKEGFVVEEAVSGMHAIQKLKSNVNFKVIICDLNMPGGVSGHDVLKFVRSSSRHKDVPFVMLTAQNEKDVVMTAITGGVTDYVLKPFKQDDLVEKIRTYIKADTA